MKKKTVSIIALALVVIGLIGYIAYSLDFDRAVQVNLSNIYVDDDYLKEQSVPYDTAGKKIISCDFEIKNYNFYKFTIYEIMNDSIIPLNANHFESPDLNVLSYGDSTLLPIVLLADENDDIDEIKKQLTDSKIEILKHLQNDGDDATNFSYLYVNKIKD